MKCVICKTGRTHPGTTTVTLQRDNSVVVIRDVPAEICEDCGEYYLSKPVASEFTPTPMPPFSACGNGNPALRSLD